MSEALKIEPKPVIVRNPDTATVYAEGLCQMMIGVPMSRMTLHKLVERNSNDPAAPEVRYLACEIIMPTVAMIDMALQLVNTFAQNQTLMAGLGAEWNAKVADVTSKLPVVDMPGTGTD